MPVKSVLLSLLIVALPALAKSKAAASAKDVESVLGKYRTSAGVQARVKKTVTQDVMGTTNESAGQFYFAKGKLRLNLDAPEKSVFVYDGKNIWLESRLDEGNIAVSHMKAAQFKRSDSLVAALFDRKDALKKFKLVSATEKAGERTYVFEPRDKKATEIRSLDVTLKAQDIRGITYKDTMENTVSFEFSDLARGAVPKGTFEYKPPQGANVTEIR